MVSTTEAQAGSAEAPRRGQRPGGLTALAVFNFILGFLKVGDAIQLQVPPIRGGLLRLGASPGYLDGLFALYLVSSALLIVAGVGYLRRSRMLGWIPGLAYGGIGLVGTIALAATGPTGAMGSTGLEIAMTIFYPAFTLFLLLLVFRHDFAG